MPNPVSIVGKALLAFLLLATLPAYGEENYDVVGDPTNSVYLLPHCNGYPELLKTQMRRHFKSLWDAEDSGYSRAADCNPILDSKSTANPKAKPHIRTASTYLPPPPPTEEKGQNCLVMETLDAKKTGDKTNRTTIQWQTRVQNICAFKILSALLFQAVDGNRDKIFERATLVEVAGEQFLQVNEKVLMPSPLYNTTSRFQIAILWEEPVHVRPKRKPPVEED